MKKIPFFSLDKQTRSLRRELDGVWKRVTNHSGFILGREVEVFEKNFARFTRMHHAVAVSSGLDALALSLKALGLGPKDEVIVPANSFIATALAVTAAGARVKLTDVDPRTLLLNEANVLKAASRRTRAVIPVHLYGQPADMPAITRLCRQKGWFVVEDAAQAHGASFKGRRCGSWGDLGAFSFYPAKNLGAFGDAGIITVSNRIYYKRLLEFRNYGAVVRFMHNVKGMNRRMDALQAGILDVKLRRLERWNRARRALARLYDRELKNVPEVTVLPARSGCVPVYHLYVIRLKKRDALNAYLNRRGIGTGLHYPIPIHLQKAYADLKQPRGRFPVTEAAAREILSLPLYPEMAARDVKCVCQTIKEFFK